MNEDSPTALNTEPLWQYHFDVKSLSDIPSSCQLSRNLLWRIGSIRLVPYLARSPSLPTNYTNWVALLVHDADKQIEDSNRDEYPTFIIVFVTN
ncbi:hypothetical protein RRG08_051334 [Elysia crispata]|uniref:Uncharacterized protein n=1 Tax=Elysia crispata TaxID=231223 RepID=A0AAE1E9A8_9GAST|nr:hypothetical protein RRG08_051334 [Elysia crispata]